MLRNHASVSVVMLLRAFSCI